MGQNNRPISPVLIGFGVVAVVATAAAIATVITIFTGLIIKNPSQGFAHLGALGSLASALAAAVAAGLSWRAIKQAQEERELEIRAGAPNLVFDSAHLSIHFSGRDEVGGIHKIEYAPSCNLSIKNIGQRPATDVTVEIYLLLANDTSPSIARAVQTDILPLYQNLIRKPTLLVGGLEEKNTNLPSYLATSDKYGPYISGAACFAINYKDPHPFYSHAKDSGQMQTRLYHVWDCPKSKLVEGFNLLTVATATPNEIKQFEQLIARAKAHAKE